MRKWLALVIVLALLVASLAGCAGEKEKVIIADFTASPTLGTPPLAVQFTDQSAGDITEWAWDFDNDGTVDSTAQNPSHTYDTVGIYTVSLKVTGPAGSDTETKANCIEVGYMIADFTASPTSGAPPLAVQFTDQSVGDITGWAWDFDNDGTVDSTAPNPSHTYNTVGEYTVSLEVTGPEGSDTETKTNYIEVAEEAQKVLKIGIVCTLSGYMGASMAPVAEMLQEFLDYVNEVEGGIDTVEGKVKIEYVTMDDEYSATTGATVYSAMRDTYHVPLIIWIAGVTAAGVMDDFAQDKIVMMTSTEYNADDIDPPGWVFALRPLPDYLGGFVKWAIEDWTGEGIPKIGFFGADAAYSLASAQYCRDWIEDQGVEFVDRWYSYTAVDYTADLLAFRDAQVDYLYFQGAAPQQAILVRDATALGLLDEMKICLSPEGEFYLVQPVVGDKIEGFYHAQMCSLYAENTPASQYDQTMQIWAKGYYDPKENRTLDEYIFILKALIAKAVADVGFENIDGEVLYNTLQQLTEVNTLGNSLDAGFGPTKRIFSNTMKMSICTKYQVLPIGGWIDMPRLLEGRGVPID
jgi:PKD repeat protein